MRRTIGLPKPAQITEHSDFCTPYLAPAWVCQLGAIDLVPLLPLPADAGICGVGSERPDDRCTHAGRRGGPA